LNKKEIEEIFKSFSDKKIMVIGDVMIDSYLFGTVDRISPEAPIPIVNVTHRENRLGGAANVALNLKSLGATPILCSVVGQDESGHQLMDLMHEQLLGTEGIVSSIHRPTTVKTRIISSNQQLIRFDEEVTFQLNELIEQEFLGQIMLLFKSIRPDSVIFQDYDKGTNTPVIIESVIAMCREHDVPVLVDPKKKNFHRYKNISLFKPNLKELKEGLNSELNADDPEAIFNQCLPFMKKQKIEQLLVTLSSKGMLACNAKEFKLIPARPRAISDVSGAGDTVIAVTGLGMAAGLDLFEAAGIANLAGGLVCEKPGVVAIDAKQLKNEL
jgi:D-glycero-beta-D-manno-heptose-7-phosphate kinase